MMEGRSGSTADVSLTSSANETETDHKSLQAHLEKLVVDAEPSRVLSRSKRITHDIFDVEICPYLVQDHAQIVACLRVCKHDEFHACRGFVVV